MSVDTYARKASFKGYTKVWSDGVELLVSRTLLTNANVVMIRQKRFLWLKWLSTYAELVGHESCARLH